MLGSRKHHVLVLGLIATTACGAAPAEAAAAGDKKGDIFMKCSVLVGGQYVIPKEKFEALADNIADPEFAKFDETCTGKRKNLEALRQSQKTKVTQAARIKHDLLDVAAARAEATGTEPLSVPAEVARTDFGTPKQAVWPLMFRDAYSSFSLLSPPDPKTKATGTQIAWTSDYLNRNYVISAKGAIIARDIIAIERGADNPLASVGITRAMIAPGVEFDESRNHNDPKKNTDYLSGRIIGELEKETPNGLFPLQYFRGSVYYKTDSKGLSRIVGSFAEWEPYNLDFAIGVAKLLFGGPIQFRWSPVLHFEGEHVAAAGNLTNVKTGDSYARVGPNLQANVFFAGGPLERLVLSTQYEYLYNLTAVSRNKAIHYWQTSAAYNIDPDGNIALNVTYRNGKTPGNYTDVRDLKAGLVVKY